ncbi:hypothetical protein [Bradyrhizobium jicamae]|uniref:hypothetical protein n=1 Tax=Bradyrhizobium jicamae TaxID=280332 RepID=UPI001BA5FC93|nr:hypothetical protein [Bradyrhizobium jicamae]MBR0936989.1 hypothetical protein [Bradyrhizobium jicamae]
MDTSTTHEAALGTYLRLYESEDRMVQEQAIQRLLKIARAADAYVAKHESYIMERYNIPTWGGLVMLATRLAARGQQGLDPLYVSEMHRMAKIADKQRAEAV